MMDSSKLIFKSFDKFYINAYTFKEFIFGVIKIEKNFSQEFDEFLSKTVLATNSAFDYHCIKKDLKKKFDISSILKRTIELLLKENKDNVLTATQFKDNVQVEVLSRYSENKYQRNYNFLSFFSHNWSVLHALIGDEWIEHILLDYSIFESLINNCYLQLSGASIANLVKKKGCELTPSKNKKSLFRLELKANGIVLKNHIVCFQLLIKFLHVSLL